MTYQTCTTWTCPLTNWVTSLGNPTPSKNSSPTLSWPAVPRTCVKKEGSKEFWQCHKFHIFFGTPHEQNNFGQDYQRSWELHLCLCLVVSIFVPCLCIYSWVFSARRKQKDASESHPPSRILGKLRSIYTSTMPRFKPKLPNPPHSNLGSPYLIPNHPPFTPKHPYT